jgi:hypothetical protein
MASTAYNQRFDPFARAVCFVWLEGTKIDPERPGWLSDDVDKFEQTERCSGRSLVGELPCL